MNYLNPLTFEESLRACPLGFFRHDLRPLEDFAHTPALVAAERPRFNDHHPIPHMALIVFIVSFNFGPTLQILSIAWMHNRALGGYHHGLLHSVANHQTAALFSQTSRAHAEPFPLWSAFSRKIVSTRAKSRLVSRSFIGFSNRLVARLSFK